MVPCLPVVILENDLSDVIVKSTVIQAECLVVLYNQNLIAKSVLTAFVDRVLVNDNELASMLVDPDCRLKFLESIVFGESWCPSCPRFIYVIKSVLQPNKEYFYNECKSVLSKCVQIALESNNESAI